MGATVLAVAIGLAVMAAAQTAKPAATSKPATAAAAAWGNSLTDAVAQSKKTGKPILAFFTGSDWCGWCMKLRGEVLDTKEFAKFAADNLVLFEADFPKGKKQTAAVKKQNDALAQKYGVRGYPTVVLADDTGKVLAQTGYQAGGAEAYIKHLKELLEKAGVKTTDAPAAGKALSPYERIKAEKAAQAAGGAAKAP